MSISNIEHKMLSGVAFLSGCLPIALIHFIRVTVIPCSNHAADMTVDIVQIFSIGFMVVTMLCAFGFYYLINLRFSAASIRGTICNLKRKDLFSSGALSCYILPFLSLLGNDIQSTISMVILIFLFLKVFINNIMFLYTPIIDVLGYKILEGTVRYITFDGKTAERQCNFLVKSDEGIYFEKADNSVVIEKLTETTFCVKIMAIA